MTSFSPEYIEIWKDINEKYAVSNHGHVKNKNRGNILKGTVNDKGYILVRVEDRKLTRLHHLVGAAFIGPRPTGWDTNHIDGNKQNNHASNLEYCTKSENSRHALNNGFVNTKLTGEQATEIREMYDSGIDTLDIARQLEFPRWKVARVIAGQSFDWLPPVKKRRPQDRGWYVK